MESLLERNIVSWKVLLFAFQHRSAKGQIWDSGHAHLRNYCAYVCVLSLLAGKRRLDLAAKQNFRHVSAGSVQQINISQHWKLRLISCFFHGHGVP